MSCFDRRRSMVNEQHRFGKLTPQGPFRSQISVFDKLLGDRRSTLTDALVAGVAQHRPGYPENVQTGVIKKRRSSIEVIACTKT